MLVPSTPEGAREFLVPSRKEPGSFYALPQSPQLFKQLLMVGGVDRYYQIARCLRDEDLRADRQYEFMQLDMEMSFVTQDDVLDAVSEAVLDAAEAVTGERPPPIERITWHEAMNRFGIDKPDLRFGLELVELTPRVRRDRVQGVRRRRRDQGHPGAGRCCATTAATSSTSSPTAPSRSAPRGSCGSRSPLERLRLAGGEVPVRRRGGRGALDDGRRDRRPDPDRRRRVDDHVRGARHAAQRLGRPPVHEGPYRYVWVVEFPLFVGVDKETGRPKPGHHPFTTPHPDDLDKIETDPMSVRSIAYDLVLNGWELGSGSIRIHEPELQRRVFHGARDLRRGGRAQVRVLPQPVRLRRTAARRVRVRARPPGGHPGGRGEHPRGDRLPEDPVRPGPDDQLADPRRPQGDGRTRPQDPPTRHLIVSDGRSARMTR